MLFLLCFARGQKMKDGGQAFRPLSNVSSNFDGYNHPVTDGTNGADGAWLNGHTLVRDL
jgi:hypothetical protein